MIRVVKLGGSLVNTAELPACLRHISSYQGYSVIVPGGGSFADQVRVMQAKFGFDDVIAHCMAILAMQQMAYLLHGLMPDFSLFSSISEFEVGNMGASIWLPQISELDASGVPASWDITSDSLAAMLAAQLKVDALLLVKAAAVSADQTLADLQELSIVDAAFCRYAAKLSCPISIINTQSFLST